MGEGNTGFSFRNPGDDGIFYDRITTDREARGLQDFVCVPRWENSFDLSPTQTVLAGVSGAFGSNDTGANTRTQIYGADLLYKWKIAASGRRISVREMADRSDVSPLRSRARRSINRFPVAETFHDWGMYSQVVWGFKKGWTTGVRGDYLHMQDSAFTDDSRRQSRSRVSGESDLVSDRVFKNPAAVQSRFSGGERFLRRSARPIRFSSSSNSSSARTARTNSNTILMKRPL